MGAVTAERAPWTKEGQEKRETVRRMFAEIAPVYDRVNGLMSLSMHRRWRAYAVSLLHLRPGDRALDICCGTGDFLVPLSRAVGALRHPSRPAPVDPRDVIPRKSRDSGTTRDLTGDSTRGDLSLQARDDLQTGPSSRSEPLLGMTPAGLAVGADYCAPMLHIAAKKLNTNRLALADACALPFASESFDAAAVGWGLRNLADLNAGLQEAARVLKPGGRFVSLDMARPKNPIVRTVSGWVCGGLLPTLGRLFGSKEAYTYLPKSTERFVSREELKAAFESAGFKDVQWKDRMFGNICILWGTKR